MSELNHVEEYCRALGMSLPEKHMLVASGGLWPSGTFIHLDCGKLDLGLMRDSTINSRNGFTVFAETFE